MSRVPVLPRINPALRFCLAPRNRAGALEIAYDGTTSLGHLIESVGVPPWSTGPARSWRPEGANRFARFRRLAARVPAARDASRGIRVVPGSHFGHVLLPIH